MVDSLGNNGYIYMERVWGKEMGKWLAEDTTALWCDHSTSY